MVIHLRNLHKIVKVKTAFLYGDTKEEIYMECSQGIESVVKDDCIVLNKCISSFVQAARQYYKNDIKIHKKLGFVGGNVNQCLYVKRSEKGTVFIAI